jgi:hypothetical protein
MHSDLTHNTFFHNQRQRRERHTLKHIEMKNNSYLVKEQCYSFHILHNI